MDRSPTVNQSNSLASFRGDTMLSTIKKGILDSARTLGYQIIKVPRYAATGDKSEYETVEPIATYSPWNADPIYQDTYNQISEHTLVDNYRCWELWSLVEQSAKLNAGHILEVGVWRGDTGAI